MHPLTGVLMGLLAAGLMTGRQEEPTALQNALGDLDPVGPWHYNNLAAGFAAARANGKPLLIVFR